MSTNHPVSELGERLGRFSSRCRSARWFGALFHVGVCQDITEDIKAHEESVRQDAFKAETYDNEAIRLMDEAMAPDSDGGAAITPKEAVRIKAMVHRSMTIDHDVTERLKS